MPKKNNCIVCVIKYPINTSLQFQINVFMFTVYELCVPLLMCHFWFFIHVLLVEFLLERICVGPSHRSVAIDQ